MEEYEHFILMIVLILISGVLYWSDYKVIGFIFILGVIGCMFLCIDNLVTHQKYKDIINYFETATIGETIYFKNLDPDVYKEVMQELDRFIDKEINTKSGFFMSGSFEKKEERR